jgi:hypothetical protein
MRDRNRYHDAPVNGVDVLVEIVCPGDHRNQSHSHEHFFSVVGDAGRTDGTQHKHPTSDATRSRETHRRAISCDTVTLLARYVHR